MGAPVHTPNACVWQGTSHSSYPHLTRSAMGINSARSQLLCAQSKKINYYGCISQLLNHVGMPFSQKHSLTWREAVPLWRVVKNHWEVATRPHHSSSHQPQGLTRDFVRLWCSQAALSTPTKVSSVLWIESSIIRRWNTCLFCKMSSLPETGKKKQLH